MTQETQHPALKWLAVGARILIVTGIYWVIFRSISFAGIQPLITPLFGAMLLIAALLNITQAAVCTARWLLLARNLERCPGFIKSFAAYLEGLFFNQALPSFVGGDAVRIVRWRAFGVGLHGAFVSVFRDRLFGAIGAAVLAIAASFLLWNLPISRFTVLMALALGVAALGGGIGVLMVIQSRRVTRWLSRFVRIHGILHRISDAPLGMKIYSLATIYSVLGQVISGASVLLLARSVGIDLPAMLLITVTGIVLVVSMIPISFAGWGVREASFLTLLVPLGSSPESVMLLGVSFGIAGLLGALPGGLSIMLGWSTVKAGPSSAQTPRSTSSFTSGP